MIARVALGLALAVSFVGACTSDDPEAVASAATSRTSETGETADSAAPDEFCLLMVEVNSEPTDPQSEVWLERYGRAAAIAPEQFREAMEAQLALIEAQAELPVGPDADDLTGNFEYMELVAATKTASFRAAAEEMATYLVDECGIEFEEQDEGAPATFTSVGPPIEE